MKLYLLALAIALSCCTGASKNKFSSAPRWSGYWYEKSDAIPVLGLSTENEGSVSIELPITTIVGLVADKIRVDGTMINFDYTSVETDGDSIFLYSCTLEYEHDLDRVKYTVGKDSTYLYRSNSRYNKAMQTDHPADDR